MIDRLDDVLASVGRHLMVDAPADEIGEPVVGADGSSSRGRGRLLVAAIVVAVLVGSIAAIPPARRAVGGWLRAGRIEVSVDPQATIDPALPSFLDDATPIDPAGRALVLGQVPPDLSSTSLGPPTGSWTVPEGGVVATWAEGTTSLWILPVDPDYWFIRKSVETGDVVTDLPELGDGGFAVAWAHLMETPHRLVVASSVVVWSDGTLMFRLESDLDVDVLITLAESIAASDERLWRS